jgi:hypothetical protein
MRTLRAIEVDHSRLALWAMTLSDAELRSFCPDPSSPRWPWDTYLNWLVAVGWRVRGSFGAGLLILETDDEICVDPQITSDPLALAGDVVQAQLDLAVELDKYFDSPGHALVEAVEWIKRAKEPGKYCAVCGSRTERGASGEIV